MFAFKIWGAFASFRDPMTISQNLSLALPPKTTVGGMMAAILGKDAYLEDKDFFDFKYSCIVLNSIRKKSFSQNYVEKYTSKVGTKLSEYEALTKQHYEVHKVKEKVFNLKLAQKELQIKTALKKSEQNRLDKLPSQLRKELKNLSKKCKKLDKTAEGIISRSHETFIKPKPTNRELILNPSYLIVIDGFKYETEIITLLKDHFSHFPFYLGNSGFPGNFQYIKMEYQYQEIEHVNSFTANIEKIQFKENQKFSNLTMPLCAVSDRQYKDFRKIVYSDSPIVLNEPIIGAMLTLQNSDLKFACDFI